MGPLSVLQQALEAQYNQSKSITVAVWSGETFIRVSFTSVSQRTVGSIQHTIDQYLSDEMTCDNQNKKPFLTGRGQLYSGYIDIYVTEHFTA